MDQNVFEDENIFEQNYFFDQLTSAFDHPTDQNHIFATLPFCISYLNLRLHWHRSTKMLLLFLTFL